MTRNNPYYDRLQDAQTVQAVNDIFDEINALPAQDRAEALQTAEDVIIAHYIDRSPSNLAHVAMALGVIEEMKSDPMGRQMLADLEADEGPRAAASAQLLRNVERDKASIDPLTTLVLNETAKLPAGQFGTAEGMYRLILMVQDAAENMPSSPAPSAPVTPAAAAPAKKKNKNNFDL